MPKPKSSKKRIAHSVRFEPAKLQEIKRAAKLDDRSVNWFIAEGAFQYCMTRMRERLNAGLPTSDAKEGGR